MPTLSTWVTDEHEHDGLRTSPEVVLDHLFALVPPPAETRTRRPPARARTQRCPGPLLRSGAPVVGQVGPGPDGPGSVRP